MREHDQLLRKYINATSFLLEGNYINCSEQPLILKYMNVNGKPSTFKIIPIKIDIINTLQQFRTNKKVIEWYVTVFLNWMKRDGWKQYTNDSIISTPIHNYIKDWVIHMIDASKQYSDAALVDELISSLPDWAKDGDLLFYNDFDMVYDLSSDPNAFGIPLKNMTDYLTARVLQGDDISKMSVPDVIRLTNEWHDLVMNKPATPDVENVDIKTIYSLPDDHKIVELLTVKALKRESALCGHCVGKGGYTDHLNDNHAKILSLRDSSGYPHATIQLIDNGIYQLKGKENGIIEPVFWNMIKDFIISKGLILKADFDKIGLKK